MHLIVGLGNPGTQYAQTRHNAGFMVLDRLASRHGLAGSQAKFHGHWQDGRIGAARCMLLKPMTYMNRSGQAVGEAVHFYDLSLTDVLLVVDDVAIPAGRIRLRPQGGAGGHNGLADVERALGSSAYPRLRIGIDQAGVVPQVDYVLQRFSPQQREQLEAAFETACDAIECWAVDGIEAAMNRFNG